MDWLKIKKIDNRDPYFALEMPEIKKNFNNKMGTTAAIKLYLNSDCCDYFFNVFVSFYHLSYKKNICI